ncbi:Helix-turn-helix domain-containing protein [Burkholderia sp. YR290]|jgi:predicted transcriptional regulator|nr:Helix-turn-helix domain-containing protein [Burkholderia sp. YR290]
MNNLKVHVGSLRDAGERFAAAWERAEKGDVFEERHVTFLSWDELVKTLTPKRLELLRHVHREGAESVKALAKALSRDYSNVHDDVAALEAAGLIVREGTRLSAPWDTLTTELSLT